ncbi:disulfide bond formation protein B [Fodinicurvata sp. EGI_FJ10296]|uniref:disulfide bond formation protein B n=1 Tax=Fodinicurvata sp. EGI_FJ10296 TaxID=3231908 RepID=UPI0034561E5B
MLISSFFSIEEIKTKVTTFQTGSVYFIISILSGAALVIALVSQHAFDIQPCQKCVIIRLCVAAAFFFSLFGIVYNNRIVTTFVFISSLVLLWQSFNNAFGEVFACGFGSPFPHWLPLETLAPWLFEVRALCGDRPISIAFDYGALGLGIACTGFAIVGVASGFHRRVAK